MIPSLHVDYKRCRPKQYFKECRALRTETTINDTNDFQIGKRLHNLPVLQEVGFRANRRLLSVQRYGQDCWMEEEEFAKVHRPQIGAGAAVDPHGGNLHLSRAFRQLDSGIEEMWEAA